MSHVTRLLQSIKEGDQHAARALLPLVYDELRKLAKKKLANESPDQTFDATALVHEAYVRMVGAGNDRQFNDQGHFFAAAAEAMRHILVEKARHKRREKHGGRRRRVELSESAPAPPSAAEELLALDEALNSLALEDPEAANLVQLRYFAGHSVEEAANAMGISRATAYRHWTFAVSSIGSSCAAWKKTARGAMNRPAVWPKTSNGTCTMNPFWHARPAPFTGWARPFGATSDGSSRRAWCCSY
jgi:RNA polymerase sigma factor (TIGR02999 family)